MSAIAYVEYSDSPIDYFPEYGMKGKRATIYDAETDEAVIVFDYYPTDEIMYWFYFEIAEPLRKTDEWVKYMLPTSFADPASVFANHVRPKAVWTGVGPDLVAIFEKFFGVRNTIRETGFEIPTRTYVAGSEMAVYEQDGTRKS